MVWREWAVRSLVAFHILRFDVCSVWHGALCECAFFFARYIQIEHTHLLFNKHFKQFFSHTAIERGCQSPSVSRWFVWCLCAHKCVGTTYMYKDCSLFGFGEFPRRVWGTRFIYSCIYVINIANNYWITVYIAIQANYRRPNSALARRAGFRIEIQFISIHSFELKF